MKLFGVIIALQIVRVFAASKIEERALAIAAVSGTFFDLTINSGQNFLADIVDKCFGSSERWSELLIIAEHPNDESIKEIHRKSKTSNLILHLDEIETRESKHPGKDNQYLNGDVKWQKSKTTGTMLTIDSPKEVDFVLSFLKNSIAQIWRPESYFLIVSENGCNTAEYNNLFKVIWGYWILDAVILCSSNDPVEGNRSEIELYTFNPYSGDHSQQWETIFHETVEVSIATGNFSHSWYIFKQTFNGIRTFEGCDDIFFDKTSNLDGYVIPISSIDSESLSDTTESFEAKSMVADSRTLKTLSKKLRFDIAQVVNHELDVNGRLHENGSYSGIMKDIHEGRSHFGLTKRGMRVYPRLGSTYPHDLIGACFATRIIGLRPQWTNLAVAKHIWIGVGVGILFFTVVSYLQNKSHGIVSAFLEAFRLIIGTSIIHSSTVAKHRIILGCAFLVVLILDGTIRGRFISILTVVRPYPNIDTIEQLKEQNIDAYGFENYRNLMTGPELSARFHSSTNASECFEALQRKEHQRACFLDCRSLRFRALNSTILHVSPQHIRTTHVIFLTAIHWPMTNRYSFEVQKLVEAGIFNKWLLDMSREIEVDGWKVKRATEPSDFKSAKLNDLLPAFVLLFIGLLISLITFIWEMKKTKYFCSVKS